MKKTLIVTCLLTATYTVFGQMSMDSIKTFIEKQVANKMSNSIIVGIVDVNGKHIVSAGVKSGENPTLPDENTIYELGSVGKLFTTLMMADMGLKNELNYNDPISKYLPKTVKIPTKNGKEITSLHLSTHRSGLPRMPYNIDPENLDNPMADYTVNQLYECVSNIELTRDIDSKWQYSNIGYGLLGQVLMSASGKDFETLQRQKITTPLGMKSTMIALTPALKSNRAMPHLLYGHPTVNWQNFDLAGAGSTSSNMKDMLTFAAANVGLIKTDLSAAMELTHVKQGKKDGNDGFITMGWTILNEDNDQILWKDGATGGYRTFIGIDKKKKYGIVILSNCGVNAMTDIGLHILDNSYAAKSYQHKWRLLDTMTATIKSKGVDAAIALYQQLKETKTPDIIFDPEQLYYLGNELSAAKKWADAIKIFELNTQEYPKIPMLYEPLAEAYKRNGDKKMAIQYFEKMLELDAKNPRWGWMINKLKNLK
jgi:serine-type D-Ala-D-Ala carboxypeptidase/endopeptidase